MNKIYLCKRNKEATKWNSKKVHMSLLEQQMHNRYVWNYMYPRKDKINFFYGVTMPKKIGRNYLHATL